MIMEKRARIHVDGKDDIQKALEAFDLTKSGFIPVKNLKHVLTKLAEELSEEEFNELVKEADPENEGRVNILGLASIISGN